MRARKRERERQRELERANRGRKRVLMGESLCEVVHRSVKRDDDHHHRHVVINAHDCPEIYARFAFRPLSARGLSLHPRPRAMPVN